MASAPSLGSLVAVEMDGTKWPATVVDPNASSQAELEAMGATAPTMAPGEFHLALAGASQCLVYFPGDSSQCVVDLAAVEVTGNWEPLLSQPEVAPQAESIRAYRAGAGAAGGTSGESGEDAGDDEVLFASDDDNASESAAERRQRRKAEKEERHRQKEEEKQRRRAEKMAKRVVDAMKARGDDDDDDDEDGSAAARAAVKRERADGAGVASSRNALDDDYYVGVGAGSPLGGLRGFDTAFGAAADDSLLVAEAVRVAADVFHEDTATIRATAPSESGSKLHAVTQLSFVARARAMARRRQAALSFLRASPLPADATDETKKKRAELSKRAEDVRSSVSAFPRLVEAPVRGPAPRARPLRVGFRDPLLHQPEGSALDGAAAGGFGSVATVRSSDSLSRNPLAGLQGTAGDGSQVMQSWRADRDTHLRPPPPDVQAIAAPGAVAARFSTQHAAIDRIASQRADTQDEEDAPLGAPSGFVLSQFRTRSQGDGLGASQGGAAGLALELSAVVPPSEEYSGASSMVESASYAASALRSEVMQSELPFGSELAHGGSELYAPEGGAAESSVGAEGQQSTRAPSTVSASAPVQRGMSWKNAAAEVIVRALGFYLKDIDGAGDAVTRENFATVAKDLTQRAFTTKLHNAGMSVSVRDSFLPASAFTASDKDGLKRAVREYLVRKVKALRSRSVTTMASGYSRASSYSAYSAAEGDRAGSRQSNGPLLGLPPGAPAHVGGEPGAAAPAADRPGTTAAAAAAPQPQRSTGRATNDDRRTSRSPQRRHHRDRSYSRSSGSSYSSRSSSYSSRSSSRSYSRSSSSSYSRSSSRSSYSSRSASASAHRGVEGERRSELSRGGNGGGSGNAAPPAAPQE